MANVTVRVFDAKTQTAYDELFYDNGNGTYSRTGGTAAATAANQAVPASASHGELAGSVTAVQMPSVVGTHALLKARANNTGNIYSGNSSGVTRPDGSTDTTTGMEIPPGELKLYTLTANLNELYRITDNAGDALTYEVW